MGSLRLTKKGQWSNTAEQRVAGTLTGLLLDCGIQINHFSGLMIGKDMEFVKRLLLSDGGLKNELFKLDNTFYEFYYVPEDENGDYLISLLIDNKRLKDIKRQLIDELDNHFGPIYRRLCEEWKKNKFEEYKECVPVDIRELKRSLNADFDQLMRKAEADGVFEEDDQKESEERKRFYTAMIKHLDKL